MIRPERCGDEMLARELGELLVLTGIAEIPDEDSAPPGLPSGRRNRPLERQLDPELAARIERAAGRLGSRIGLLREDLASLELAHRKLLELLEQGRRDRGDGPWDCRGDADE